MTLRTKHIDVRVTTEQYERIKNNARLTGKPMSLYLMNLALQNDVNLVYKVVEIHNIVKKIQDHVMKK